jgi:hypothetical protein
MSNYHEMPNMRWPGASAVPTSSNGASPHLSDELLAAWTADELADDERSKIQRHLESCAYCQRALAETQRIRALVGAAAGGTQPVALPSVADRMLERLPDRSDAEAPPSAGRPNEGRRHMERARRNRRRDLWRRVSALAAVLLLIASSVLVFTRLSSQGNPSFKPGPPGVKNIAGNWTDVLPTQSYVADVAVVSPTDIWAVGEVDLGAAKTALLMHFDGRYWQRSPDEFPFVLLTCISMVSADEGWACGVTSDLSPVLLHYSGGHWRNATASLDTRTLRSPKVALTTVRMLSATDGWALGTDSTAPVGDQPSLVFQYMKVGNSYRWEPVESLSDTTLMALSVVSDHEVWLVGYTGVEEWKTTIVRLTASDAAGASNSPAVHWDAQSWTVGDGQLTSISMLSSTDGWVGGATPNDVGLLYHWDGRQWSQRRFAPAGNDGTGVENLVMTGSDAGWIYWQDGNSLYAIRNGQWYSYPLGESNRIAALAPVTPTTLLAIVISVKDINTEYDVHPVPVIFEMRNGTLVPTATSALP